MDFTLDYASLVKKLERQELESPSGIASPQVYGQLMAIYLLLNDLTSAKFLWKRIPQDVRNDNIELQEVWKVARCLWLENYPEMYKTIRRYNEWPNHLKNIMNLILETCQQRACKTISTSFSSINITTTSQLLGLTEDETIKYIKNLDWIYDENTRYVHPKNTKAKQIVPSKSSNFFGAEKGTELLKKLTDYIVFLENAQ